VPKPVISGGEEDLAHLVLRLAISQMIAERAGQSFSLLILDEVFGSLDDARRHNVVELLRRLQDRFEQVILITHIESVREGLDRVVTVRYDDDRGCAVIEQTGADELPLARTRPRWAAPRRQWRARPRDAAQRCGTDFASGARPYGAERLMAVARNWKQLRQLDGPHRAQRDDIPALNQVFSDAFTDRYRRDGMVGVRVPNLNPAIWRYALDDAGDGAMVWRGE